MPGHWIYIISLQEFQVLSQLNKTLAATHTKNWAFKKLLLQRPTHSGQLQYRSLDTSFELPYPLTQILTHSGTTSLTSYLTFGWIPGGVMCRGALPAWKSWWVSRAREHSVLTQRSWWNVVKLYSNRVKADPHGLQQSWQVGCRILPVNKNDPVSCKMSIQTVLQPRKNVSILHNLKMTDSW